MNDRRSKSYADSRTEIEVYNRGATDIRSYSTSSGYHYKDPGYAYTKPELKKSKSKWEFRDPDFQRRKRVAGYKAIGYQGKFKGSLKKGFKWLKTTYFQVIYGWS